MTSKQSDENTENCNSPTQLESLNIDERLAALYCPFNWGLYGISRIEDEKLRAKRKEEQFQFIVDTRDYLPEYELIYHLINAYRHAVDDELQSAMECMNKAEQNFADIKEKEVLKDVEKSLHHLVMGSKCHLLKKLGQLTEVDQLLKEICDIDGLKKKEFAMLIGSHCIAFSLFANTVSERKDSACLAIKIDPTNGKWHYLLGNSYRDSRRSQFLPFKQPGDEEISAFKEAYRLSPNVLFGVYLAQLYRESRNYDMANKIYKEVHDLQPTSCTIQFQLALGFIRAPECIRAKECLDYIAERMPDSLRYTHYMGIYEEKCNKNLQAALAYYQRATEGLNSAAEWQYVECRKKVEPDWDPLPYLLDMLKKYKLFSDDLLQEINIRIGSYYLFDMHDVLSACEYLTKAIEMDPSTKRLKNYVLLFRPSEKVNLYHVLAKEAQFALKIGDSVYDEDKISVLKNALEICRKNCLDLSAPPEIFRPQVSSSRRPDSYRNEGRSTSSREIINWREEKPGSSSRGLSKNEFPRRGSDRSNPSNRFSSTFQQRDYTSWRSTKRPIQDNTCKDEEVSASTNCVRDRGVRRTGMLKPQNKDDHVEASASCHLVKMVKDLNL